MHGDDEFDEAFVNGVRTAMRAGAADLSVPPTLLPTLRTRYARRIAARRAGLVAAPLVVAALVVGGVSVTAVPGPSGSTAAPASTPSTRSTGETHEVRDVALVAPRIVEALDGVEGHVVHQTVVETGEGKWSKPDRPAVYDTWMRADARAIRIRTTIEGEAVWERSEDLTRDVTIHHLERTWAINVVPASAPPGKTRVRVTDEIRTPTMIREALASGQLEIVGEGDVIDGEPTVHLRGSLRGGIGFWVNATTYLPVRTEEQEEDGTWGAPTDLNWLPPTPENLALLEASVPDGYTEKR
ncbi:hypothetical protein [Umezawaea beigongshangensis]|uniref:hypothetical protein n=1 Tax=Umezawaea beigongshangensis TaxID=2780383 RepID=UPI0018F20E11|nr:hypothetical protein [Umezawaea beigongshangensis]